MSRPTPTPHFVASALACVVALLGCNATPDAAAPLATAPPTPTAPTAPEDPMLAQTRAMAARLLAAEGTTPANADAAPFDPFPDSTPVYERPTPPATASASASPAEPAPPVFAPPTPPPTAAAAPAAALSPDRAALLDRLTRAVAASDDPALAKALAGVGLSLADPAATLDPRFLQPLRPTQRQQVETVHRVLLALREQAAAGGDLLTRAALLDRLDAAFADEPVRIVAVELCRSVQSFGVYEPFATANFLGGQVNRAIVYLELDHFETQPVGNEHEVRLKQELILYNESDGLAVWKADPVQVVDVSRNRRRDFYVVQMMSLPARLAPGKYRLKIRITDEHGESVDETTTPIQIVADEALLSEAAPAE